MEVEREPSGRVVADDSLVHVDGALRGAGRSAREVDERHVVGGGGTDLVVVGRRDQQPAVILGAGDTRGRALLADEDDVLEVRKRVEEGCHLPAVQSLGRDEDLGPADREAGANRLRAERREEGGEHAAVLEGSERGDVQLGNSAGERADDVTRADPEGVEGVREAIREHVQVGEREVADGALLAEPAECQLVSAARGHVAVDGFVSDVETSARQAVQALAGARPEVAGALGLVVDEIRRHRPALDGLQDRCVSHNEPIIVPCGPCRVGVDADPACGFSAIAQNAG